MSNNVRYHETDPRFDDDLTGFKFLYKMPKAVGIVAEEKTRSGLSDFKDLLTNRSDLTNLT